MNKEPCIPIKGNIMPNMFEKVHEFPPHSVIERRQKISIFSYVANMKKPKVMCQSVVMQKIKGLK
ncbi:hypothetical protein CIP107565_01728 [Corynebacterium diphtheriae]|nr:hypothetical protein CIP107565_01728 [Corynebacterium diphtheriae]